MGISFNSRVDFARFTEPAPFPTFQLGHALGRVSPWPRLPCGGKRLVSRYGVASYEDEI
jgi:hypothetical protein